MAPPDPAGTARAVDAHHHLWDPDDHGQDWLRAPGLEPLDRPFTAADLHEASSAGVDRRQVGASVVVQAIADPDETLRLLATAAADDVVTAVVGWVDLTGDVAGQLDALREAPGGENLVGIRHLVQDEDDPGWMLRDDVQRGLRTLAARSLPYDVLVREPQREASTRAVRGIDGLPLVLDHAGKPDLRRAASPGSFEEWGRQVREFAAIDGSVCKVSGLITEADADWTPADIRPAVDVLLDAFGPSRLAFGSDWPVCLLAGSWARWAEVATSFAAELSSAERDQLFGGTARSVYRLPSRSPS